MGTKKFIYSYWEPRKQGTAYRGLHRMRHATPLLQWLGFLLRVQMREGGQLESFICILFPLKTTNKESEAEWELFLIWVPGRCEHWTGTYIGSSFQKSPGTGHVIAEAGFVQWGDMVYGDRVYVITLNVTWIILEGEKKFCKVISTVVTKEGYKRSRNVRKVRCVWPERPVRMPWSCSVVKTPAHCNCDTTPPRPSAALSLVLNRFWKYYWHLAT